MFNRIWLKSFIFLLCVIITGIIITYVSLSEYLHSFLLEKARKDLLFVAENTAQLVSIENHRAVLKKKNYESREYLQEVVKLEKAWHRMEHIKYVYTMAQNNEGEIIFVVDPTPAGDNDNDGVEDKALIGEVYKNAPGVIKEAFAGRTVVSEPYRDKWGHFVSAYVPVVERNGSVHFIIGADYTIDYIDSSIAGIMNRIFYNLLPLLCLIFIIPVIISIAIRRRFQKISLIVRDMARGDDRDYRKGEDAFEAEFYPFLSTIFSIIKKQRETEKGLMESRRQYQLLADNISDIIWTLDNELKITYVSPSVYTQLGYEPDELIDTSIKNILTEEAFGRAAESAEGIMHEYREKGASEAGKKTLLLEHMTRSNTVRTFEVVGSLLFDDEGGPAGIVGSSRDVTERLEVQRDREYIQKQLFQAQKMETVGSLVSGVSHDFNNILGGITGSISILKHILQQEENETAPDAVMAYINMIEKSSDRAFEMVQQLLTLARKREVQLQPVNLHSSVMHVISICESSFDKSVKIIYENSDESLAVIADPTQLEQVILNLCINAYHAMTLMRPADALHGGTLTIEVEKRGCDEISPHQNESVIYGAYCEITVSDTGVGIDREIIENIFDPFFSTKEKHEGTGLGLSMVYNIIKQHNGHLTVDSKAGEGSVFTIYLPVSDAEKEDKGLKKNSIIKGNGTVLVVDDEASIRKVASHMLELCGYSVLTAEDGEEGIKIFRENAASVDAVILDISMPQKSGLEAFIEMKEINPGLKVIVSSGFKQDSRVQKILDLGGMVFMQKPFTLNELSEIVHSVVTG